jgi:hypothetical protein
LRELCPKHCDSARYTLDMANRWVNAQRIDVSGGQGI